MFSAGSRRLLENNDVADAFNDAKEGVISFKEGFWGGSCTNQEQCTDYIATCGDQGKCRGSTSCNFNCLSCLIKVSDREQQESKSKIV